MVILSFMLGALTMLSGVYIGLSWHKNVTAGGAPQIPVPQLIKPKEKAAPVLPPEIVQEWFEGKKEGD